MFGDIFEDNEAQLLWEVSKLYTSEAYRARGARIDKYQRFIDICEKRYAAKCKIQIRSSLTQKFPDIIASAILGFHGSDDFNYCPICKVYWLHGFCKANKATEHEEVCQSRAANLTEKQCIEAIMLA